MTGSMFSPLKSIIERVQANYTGLPLIGKNDDGKDLSLDDGFIQIDAKVFRSSLASINGPTPKYRGVGQMIFDIYTPLDTGVKDGRDIADELCVIFVGQTFEGVNCTTPALAESLKAEYSDKKLWLTRLICNFWFDQRYTVA